MTPITEKEAKLFRIAVDPAAGPGEQENAAIMFFRSMRERGARLEEPKPQPMPVVQWCWPQTPAYTTNVYTW